MEEWFENVQILKILLFQSKTCKCILISHEIFWNIFFKAALEIHIGWCADGQQCRNEPVIKDAANPIFSISGNCLNTTSRTTLDQLSYKIYSMWFITSESMPRASWGKHVLWMFSSEYLMNWWVTVWSLAKAGPNIIRACWAEPRRNHLCLSLDSFWPLLANKWKHWFHPMCSHRVSFSLSLHV